MSPAHHAIAFVVLGMLVAIPLDALHVVTGVLSYRDPMLWGLQDWWVFPLFAASGLALGGGHRYVARRLSGVRSLPPSTGSSAALGALALIAAYGSSGFLQAWPWLTLALYVAGFLGALVVVDARARTTLLVHAGGSALIGPLVELAISSTGEFTYARPDFFGVPVWLPGIYLHAGLASHLLDRAMEPAP